MRCIVIDKIPYLKRCRKFFRLEYGNIDYDALIDCLCLGITGEKDDWKHIRDMVHGDILFQGHQDRSEDGGGFTARQKTKLMKFLFELRGEIVAFLRRWGMQQFRQCRYLPNMTTGMSLKFEIFY